MCRLQTKRQRATNGKMPFFTKIAHLFLFLIFVTTFYLVLSFTPLTKEEQIEDFDKMSENIEPFRKNLTECARQVQATFVDVDHFLKRMPAESMQGKCLVACILKRNQIITNNKINKENLLEANKAVYGIDSEVVHRMLSAVEECSRVIETIFEICEYASVFNDCMHIKMEHILDKMTMERRMEALGQMTSDPDHWSEDDDEILKMVKDEL